MNRKLLILLILFGVQIKTPDAFSQNSVTPINNPKLTGSGSVQGTLQATGTGQIVATSISGTDTGAILNNPTITGTVSGTSLSLGMTVGYSLFSGSGGHLQWPNGNLLTNGSGMLYQDGANFLNNGTIYWDSTYGPGGTFIAATGTISAMNGTPIINGTGSWIGPTIPLATASLTSSAANALSTGTFGANVTLATTGSLPTVQTGGDLYYFIGSSYEYGTTLTGTSAVALTGGGVAGCYPVQAINLLCGGTSNCAYYNCSVSGMTSAWMLSAYTTGTTEAGGQVVPSAHSVFTAGRGHYRHMYLVFGTSNAAYNDPPAPISLATSIANTIAVTGSAIADGAIPIPVLIGSLNQTNAADYAQGIAFNQAVLSGSIPKLIGYIKAGVPDPTNPAFSTDGIHLNIYGCLSAGINVASWFISGGGESANWEPGTFNTPITALGGMTVNGLNGGTLTSTVAVLANAGINSGGNFDAPWYNFDYNNIYLGIYGIPNQYQEFIGGPTHSGPTGSVAIGYFNTSGNANIINTFWQNGDTFLNGTTDNGFNLEVGGTAKIDGNLTAGGVFAPSGGITAGIVDLPWYIYNKPVDPNGGSLMGFFAGAGYTLEEFAPNEIGASWQAGIMSSSTTFTAYLKVANGGVVSVQNGGIFTGNGSGLTGVAVISGSGNASVSANGLLLGQMTEVNMAAPGVNPGDPVVVAPPVNPPQFIGWGGYVATSGTITLRLTAIATVTGTAQTWNCKAIKQ